MNRVLIIEDEAPALQRLMNLVQDFDADLEIAGTAGSVKGGVAWLKKHNEPDLILLDIQLTDGLSTEIFQQYPVQCPVIFVTAFDSFIIQAFEYHCLDYVLKPVNKERLHKALEKYLKLKAHFEGKLTDLGNELKGVSPKKFAERLLVRKGMEQFSLAVDDVAYFYTEHKVVFAVDMSGTKYLTEQTLKALTENLNPKTFHRLNRKYLAQLNSVASFKSLAKGRVEVKLKPTVNEEVLVSQPQASEFKKWMEG